MNIINSTVIFAEWLDKLRDANAQVRILTRINRARSGNFGEYKVLGDGVCEMKID